MNYSPMKIRVKVAKKQESQQAAYCDNRLFTCGWAYGPGTIIGYVRSKTEDLAALHSWLYSLISGYLGSLPDETYQKGSTDS